MASEVKSSTVTLNINDELTGFQGSSQGNILNIGVTIKEIVYVTLSCLFHSRYPEHKRAGTIQVPKCIHQVPEPGLQGACGLHLLVSEPAQTRAGDGGTMGSPA